MLATVANSNQIQQMHNNVIPVKTKQTMYHGQQIVWASGQESSSEPRNKEIYHSARTSLLQVGFGRIFGSCFVVKVKQEGKSYLPPSLYISDMLLLNVNFMTLTFGFKMVRKLQIGP